MENTDKKLGNKKKELVLLDKKISEKHQSLELLIDDIHKLSSTGDGSADSDQAKLEIQMVELRRQHREYSNELKIQKDNLDAVNKEFKRNRESKDTVDIELQRKTNILEQINENI